MSVPKIPAVLVYTSDFLSGTVTMSLEEVGAYWRCLLVEWETGGVPTDREELARVMGCTPHHARRVWRRIQNKFFVNDDGRFCNKRLETERAKAAKNRKKFAKNSQKSAKSRGPATSLNSQKRSGKRAKPADPAPPLLGLLNQTKPTRPP